MSFFDQRSRSKQVTTTIIVFLIFLIIPLCVGIMYYNTGTGLNQQISSQLKDEENIAASAIQIKLNHLVGIASSLAESPELVAAVVNGKWDDAAAIARDAQNNTSFYDPYIDRIVFFDEKGIEKSAYPTLAGGIGVDASSSAWFTTVVQNDVPAVSSVSKRHATPSLDIVYVAAPIHQGNTVLGVLAMQIPTENFLDFGYALSMGTYGFTYIVDQKGNVVAHPKYSMTDIINLASATPTKEILAGQSGTLVTGGETDSQSNFLVYGQIPNYNWGIVIQEPYDEVFAPYNTLMHTMAIVESLLLAIDLLVSYLVFRFLSPKKDPLQIKQ